MAKKNIATFLGPQKGLLTIGSHCYAFSGLVVGTTSGFTTYMKFNTGKSYSIVKMEQGSTNETTRKEVKVHINGTLVIYQDVDNSYPFPNTWDFLIPPLSEVEVTLKLGGDDGMKSWFTIVGRVYDA